MNHHFSFIDRLLSPFRHINFPRRHIDVTSVRQSYAPDTFFLDNKNSECENVWSKRFTVRNFHPKSLPEVNYDEILNGEVEDFSPDCWLDGHIHRFADAHNIHHVLYNEHEYFSSNFASSEDSISDPMSFISSGSESSSPLIGYSHRNNLIDLSGPILSDPPPYSDDPPPSYEEAISTFINMQDSPREGSGSDWMW